MSNKTLKQIQNKRGSSVNQTLILINTETHNELLYEAAMSADVVTVAMTSAVAAARKRKAYSIY